MNFIWLLLLLFIIIILNSYKEDLVQETMIVSW